MRKTILKSLMGAGHVISVLAFHKKVRSIRFRYVLTLLIIIIGFNTKPVGGVENNVDVSGEKEVHSEPCNPSPITIPKAPKMIPGYAELDKTTGLHVTGTMPEIDFGNYRLEVVGKVTNPLKLSYDELRCLPKVEARPTLVCPGFFKDVATWAGTPIKHVLQSAGPQKGVREIRLISADEYEISVSLKKVYSGSGFLAYEWEGKPLPLLHGFPLRAVFPELDGSYWVKWLIKIEVR